MTESEKKRASVEIEQKLKEELRLGFIGKSVSEVKPEEIKERIDKIILDFMTAKKIAYPAPIVKVKLNGPDAMVTLHDPRTGRLLSGFHDIFRIDS